MPFHRRFLPLLASAACLVAAPPEPPLRWQISLPPLTEPVFRVPGSRSLKDLGPTPPKLDLEPGAVVEVWGDGPAEALKAVAMRLRPQLAAAALKGFDSRTNAQMLAEFIGMAMSGQEIRPPSTPSVHYNCLRPIGYDPAVLPYTAQGGLWLNPAGASGPK
jgi:hypothetical protein